MHLNVWNLAKAIFRGKYIVLNACIRKESSEINDLNFYLHNLEKQKQTKP